MTSIPSGQLEQTLKLTSNIFSLIFSEDYRNKIMKDKEDGTYNSDLLDVNNDNPLESILIPVLKFLEPKPFVIKTVDYLDLEKYSGLWYEIARLPNSFEVDVHNVTAQYTLKDNKIEVINCGTRVDGSVNKVVGSAISKDATNSRLAVTFFWPFAGDYNVIELGHESSENDRIDGSDKLQYDYSVVCGSDKYLWVLSRTPTMDQSVLNGILERLDPRFDQSKLIYTDQTH